MTGWLVLNWLVTLFIALVVAHVVNLNDLKWKK
jgi:hypothetical protein